MKNDQNIPCRPRRRCRCLLIEFGCWDITPLASVNEFDFGMLESVLLGVGAAVVGAIFRVILGQFSGSLLEDGFGLHGDRSRFGTKNGFESFLADARAEADLEDTVVVGDGRPEGPRRLAVQTRLGSDEGAN